MSAPPTTIISIFPCRSLVVLTPWHFLNFLPLPHEHKSLRPVFAMRVTSGRSRDGGPARRGTVSQRAGTGKTQPASISRPGGCPMRRALAVLLASLSVAFLSAQARTTLDIYLVDVEGGNATLFVAPSGDSLLID